MMAIAFLGYLYSPKWLNNDNMIVLNTLFPNAIINNFNKDKKINPVYVFEDLHTQFTKDLIKNKTSGISGIYMILNKLTLDYYIGSASTNKIYSRFVNHMLYFSGSKVVKHAVQKYGISNFAFILLEIFPKTVDQQTNKELLDLEDFYLKSLLPNYNILTEAGNSFGYKHTEITRIKMKSSYSVERRLKIGLLNKDKNLSDSTIEKMRISALQRKPYNYSCAAEEGLLNMKKKSKALSVLNLDGTLYGKYSSITEAAKDLNCGVKTINRSLKTEKKLLKRQWKIKLEN
jgi:group I intron endonuclease